MPSLKRVRHGSTAVVLDAIQVGDQQIGPDAYAGKLSNRAEALIQLAGTVKASDASVAKALCCGRIVSRKSTSVYQRCWYCRIKLLCPVCEQLYAECRAAEQIGDIRRTGGRLIAFRLLFTTPPPANKDEEHFQVRMAVEARKTLFKFQRRWNDSPERLDQPSTIVRTFLALHLKPVVPGGLIAPHLHGVIVAKQRLRLRDLKTTLEDWWDQYLYSYLNREGFADIQLLGRIGVKPKTGSTRSSSHPKTVSLDRVKNQLAYDKRLFKKDETPADLQHRVEVLNQLRVKSTSWASCTASPTASREYVPHQFDPRSLGHDQMLVFGFSEGAFVQSPVETFEQAKKALLSQAAKFVKHARAQSAQNIPAR